MDHTDSNTIYVVRHGGDEELNNNWSRGFVYKSADAGTTWSQVGAGQLEGGRPYVLMLRGGTSATRTLLATVYGVGIYQSMDSGATWTSVSTGIETADLTALWSLAEGVGDVVYLGSGDMSPEGSGFSGSIYRSADAGVSWQKLSGSTVPSGQIQHLDVGTDGVVYAATTSNSGWLQTGTGTNKGGLYRSADEGATWSLVIEQPHIDGVSVRKDDPTQVVAAVSSFWNQLDDGTHDLVEPGIYMSTDSGLTFTRETAGLTHTFYWFIKYDPVNTNQFYAGTRGGGIFMGATSTSAGDTDTDGDGVPDSTDAFDDDATESVDTDGDGTGNNADTDDDGDGIADSEDAFPLDSSESIDTDGDGTGNVADTDDDGDGVADSTDAFPLDSSESIDTDGDGTGDAADTDDDNDGVVDDSDTNPLDSSLYDDADGDGLNADADNCPSTSNADQADADNNGVGDACGESDQDNDGVIDSLDAFPTDPTESVDTDSDGAGDNLETEFGTDPTDAADCPAWACTPNSWWRFEEYRQMKSDSGG